MIGSSRWGILKLDLHVHCLETVPFSAIGPQTVERIIDVVKSRGLDGIAITEHNDKCKSLKVKEIVSTTFNDEILIIPGQEIHCNSHHVVELYLPYDLTFRFIAHPGKLESGILDNIQGIEVESGVWYIDKEPILRLCQQRSLVPLCNSDAHSLSEVGSHHTQIGLADLCTRARLASNLCNSYNEIQL